MNLILTAGQRGDAPQAIALLGDLRPRHVLADAAYDSAAIRERIERTGGRACIPPHPTHPQRGYDRERYRHRNVVERFFGAIKRFRRVATRYEKKPENYLGFTWLAAILVSVT